MKDPSGEKIIMFMINSKSLNQLNFYNFQLMKKNSKIMKMKHFFQMNK